MRLEQQVLRVLQVPWVQPALRERPALLVRLAHKAWLVLQEQPGRRVFRVRRELLEQQVQPVLLVRRVHRVWLVPLVRRVLKVRPARLVP